MSTIAENISIITQKIAEINPAARLVAATKTRNIEEIREAMATGKVLAAGENRVQELREKYVPEFRWDFIGQLQTNKVKYIVDKVDLIHSVDRLSLVEVIDKESKKHDKITDILVEINSGKEESKGGIFLEDTERFLDEISPFENVRARGLMAVAPVDFGEDDLKRTFDGVYNVYSKLKKDGFDYLSMGMSNDYLIAVKCGANLVRLGRAIFGERRQIDG